MSVEADFLQALMTWFARNPERTKSDEYYRRRINEGAAISAGELALVDWFRRHRRAAATGCEIGCGFGQLSAMLDGAGIAMTAVDGDLHRVLGAHAIRTSIGGHYELVHGYFPEAVAGRRFDFCVATNLVNSWWDGQPGDERQRWAAMLALAGELIFDAALWFKDRDEVMQEALIADLRAWGFAVKHAVGTFWSVRP